MERSREQMSAETKANAYRTNILNVRSESPAVAAVPALPEIATDGKMVEGKG